MTPANRNELYPAVHMLEFAYSHVALFKSYGSTKELKQLMHF